MNQEQMTISRRSFLSTGPGLCLVSGSAMAVLGAAGPRRSRGTAAAGQDGSVPQGFPQQDPRLVEEVVRYSHFDLDRVRELVKAKPALAKASWDWGFGDWESALGAASHTGRRSIALFLLENGARPNIFTFAMLGHLAAVKAMIEARPGVQRLQGPHGITLLQHAIHGGDAAAEVADYLRSIGDADIGQTNLPLTAEEIEGYLGRYRFDGEQGGSFEIIESRGMIAFKHSDQVHRRLCNQGDHTFHPTGAPAVRFAFDVTDGRAASVSIRDAEIVVRASRIG